MTLDQFIDQYDFEGSVILLEGKLAYFMMICQQQN